MTKQTFALDAAFTLYLYGESIGIECMDGTYLALTKEAAAELAARIFLWLDDKSDDA